MPHQLEAVLRVHLATPAAWYACAREHSELLAELATDVLDEFAAITANPSRPPNRLMGLYRAFLLLAAHAAENYIKGLWVAANGFPPPKPGALLHDRLAHHRLSDLASEAHVTLPPGSQVLLAVLADAVMWHSRYPAPRKPEVFSLFGPDTAQIPLLVSLVSALAQLASVSNGRPA